MEHSLNSEHAPWGLLGAVPAAPARFGARRLRELVLIKEHAACMFAGFSTKRLEPPKPVGQNLVEVLARLAALRSLAQRCDPLLADLV